MGNPSFPESDFFVLERDYIEAENIPRALQAAYRVLHALRNGDIDWYLRREEIESALKVICDAPGGSPSFAHNTMMLIQPDLRQPERWEAGGPLGRALAKACNLTIMAEVAHRCKRYRQAVIWAETAMGVIQRAASQRGDDASLLKKVSSSQRNAVAAGITAAISAWMPALRRASFPPQVKEDYHERLEPFIAALLSSGQIYSRSDAFGSQTLFYEAERLQADREPEDQQVARIVDLRDVAAQTWGTSKRALATAPLLEMEFLRATGDVERAREQAALARVRLIDFGLPRHLERMVEYRYLTF
jgi:hypothetical protein